MNRIENFIEKNYKVVFAVTLLTYFFINYSNGLIKGGRWDLYQNIATADRFLDGKGFYYSTTEASSPYFPGVAFLAVIVGKLFYSVRDYILLAIASLIGTAFMAELINLGTKFSRNKWLSLICTSALLFSGFDKYKSYMNEFKADSAVLLIAIAIILLIDKFEKKEKVTWKDYALLFILAFIMDVTKQQALYVDAGLGIYLLFFSNADFKNRVKLLVDLIMAGILDLVVVFSVPNLNIIAIENLSEMPYWSKREIVLQMGDVVKNHIVFFALLFAFAFLLILRKVAIDHLAIKWLLISVVFGCGQILGGWKIGGNAGNYEVGMVAFMPFVVIAAVYIIDYFIKAERMQLVYTGMGLVLSFYSVAVLGHVAFYKMPQVKEKVVEDAAASQYLSEVFGDAEILYYSNEYMQISRSTVCPGTDIYTIPHNIEEYWGTKTELLVNKTYQYIYIEPSDLSKWDKNMLRDHNYESNLVAWLKVNYTLIEDENMPAGLAGKLYVAK